MARRVNIRQRRYMLLARRYNFQSATVSRERHRLAQLLLVAPQPHDETMSLQSRQQSGLRS